MAIAAVFVLTAVAFVLLYLGYWKEDYTTLLFASITFILLGLYTYINGFEELSILYAHWIGIIFAAFGAYIGLRSGIELIQQNL